MAVEAPTLKAIGLNTHEKMIPPKDETKYSVASFHDPRPFSRPEPMTIVERRLRHKCTKLACKNVGVINLQTCPLFLIFLASFHPSASKARGLGAKNSVLTILYNQSDIVYIIMSIITM